MDLVNSRNGPVWVTTSDGNRKLLKPMERATVSPGVYSATHPLVAGGLASIPKIRMGVKHVYVFSASILDYSMARDQNQRNCLANLIRNAGLPVPQIVTTWANRGDDLQRYEAKLAAMLNHARGKEGVLVIYHGPGNDITQKGPWPGGADDMDAASRRIFRAIRAEGHQLMIASVSYRQPGASNPSAPYNLNLTHDWIKEFSPDFWRDGEPVFNLYEATLAHPEFFNADGVHPNDPGQHAIRVCAVDAMRKAIMGDVGLMTAAEISGRRIIYSPGDDLSFYNGINPCIRSAETMGSGTSGSHGAATCLTTRDVNGDVLPGVRFDAYLHTSVNTGGEGDESDTSDTLTNGRLLMTSMYCHSSATGAYFEVSGLPNGATGTMRMTGIRARSTGRIGDYTYRKQTKQMSSSGTPGLVEFPVVIENGKIRVDWKCSGSSEFCYINGIEIVFD